MAGRRCGAAAGLAASAAVLVAVGLVPTAGAAEGPRPPCGGAEPIPPYAEIGAVANVATWSGDEIPGGWRTPACTGWEDAEFQTLAALSARFRYDGDIDGLLERLGAISAWKGVRYWSVSEGGWEPLAEEAYAVADAAEDPERRGDFSAAELRGGGGFYFYQEGAGAGGGAFYEMHVLEAEPGRLVVAVDNASEIEAAVFVTLFEPGALQTVYFFERLSDGVWGHYSLTRAREAGASDLAEGHDRSFLNRAAAIYRHVAGIPTDREPPVAQ